MILDGKAIASEIQKRIAQKTRALSAAGIQPGFAAVLVGDDPASTLYVDMKGRVADQLGFHFRKIHFPSDTTTDEVCRAVRALSDDPLIHGIIVQIPLPGHIDQEAVVREIDPAKDIDCFHPDNLRGLFDGASRVAPPTAEAVLRLIESAGVNPTGQRVVVIGDGFFGRQIAAHCTNNGAHVTIMHPLDEKLIETMHEADVVVSAVGMPGLIRRGMLSRESVIIDVGITRSGSTIAGDVVFDEVKDEVRAVTPVPGGVGPMTVILLMENVLKATERSVDET